MTKEKYYCNFCNKDFINFKCNHCVAERVEAQANLGYQAYIERKKLDKIENAVCFSCGKSSVDLKN